MFERDFFEGWMGSVVSPMTGDLEYPDKYRTTMRIYQLDKMDNKVYAVELYNVFCKMVSDMELSTDASDQISTITITLSFSEYQTIGKTTFWYDPRKDRGGSSVIRSTADAVAVQMRGQDINNEGMKSTLGDLKYIMDQ